MTGSQRLDKWLWHARFFKTRSLATRVVQTGKVRVNSFAVSKPARAICIGDVLTFPKDDFVRVIEICGIGERRGPAPEAQELYNDLDPPQPKPKQAFAPKSDTKPTARDRRAQADFKRGLI